ncbi:hypothetical protein ACHWQZ_G002312 [Mnemiopsis leidyi]
MREHCKTISHPWVRTPPYYPVEGADKIGPSGHYPFKRPVNLKENPTHWTLKRYTGLPVDCRLSAPVPSRKINSDQGINLKVENYWLAPSPDHPRNFCRTVEEPTMYSSKPATRCEEWSTLRCMLPSQGVIKHQKPPKWGTGHALPPIRGDDKTTYTFYNSPMTDYVDDMHASNKLFKLF